MKKGLFKNVFKNKFFLVYFIINIVFIICGFYFALPFFNLRDRGSFLFYFYIIAFITSVILTFVIKAKQMKEGTEPEVFIDDKPFSKEANKHFFYSKNATIGEVLIKTLSIALIAAVIFLSLCSLFESKMFNAKRYQKQLEIREGTEEEFLETFDYKGGNVSLPLIDKDVAFRLAETKLGDYGSQYNIDYANFTLLSRVNSEGKTELIRVTPLEYANVFVAMSRMSKGSIGYIEINCITSESKLILFDENDGLKYMPSGIFNYDLDRHIRFKYPTAIYESKKFEVDDQGNPYWVVPVLDKQVGIFSGQNPSGVILVNPITGEMNRYKLGEEPSWVQRCVDERTVEAQANNALSLKNGYWNTHFAKKDVFNLSDGYNYFLKDGHTYYVSCITSSNANDETSVGFITVDLKTKQAVKYSATGATEDRARQIAMMDERVKAQQLDATWPILISYNGVQTYFICLKNDVQVQKFVYLNVYDGTMVAIGNTIEEAQSEYNHLLKNSGHDESEEKKLTGVIDRVKERNGFVEFTLVGDSTRFFKVKINLNLDSRFLQSGDKVEITYKENSDSNDGNFVVDIKIIE